MSITVYNISGSPMGWRVLLGLTFKEVDYNVHYLSGADNEQRQDAFLKLNPHGKVPVLEHNGSYRRESLSILGWLDEEFPERPLFGETAKEIRAIWRCAVRHSDYLLKSTSDVVFPVFNGTDGTPKTSEETNATLELSCHLLRAELTVLEQELSDSPFLCGGAATAADAVAYPDIGRIMRAIQTKPASMSALGFGNIDQDFPKIAQWRDRITALPDHAKTVPPHWVTSN